jgi:hypothetical protein
MTVSIPLLGNWLENGRTQPILTILELGVIYFVSVFIYRRFFHPLAKFPGPIAASASTQWLYKRLMTGHAEEAFEKLHEHYSTFHDPVMIRKAPF